MEHSISIPRLHPIRVYAIDQNGVIQVIDSERTGIAEIIKTWGDQNSSLVLAASLTNKNKDPLLAVARSNSKINVIDPHDGTVVLCKDYNPKDPIVGLHYTSDQGSRLFTCTLQAQTEIGLYTQEGEEYSNKKWDLAKDDKDCHLLFSKFHEMEDFSIFGGRNAALHKFNLETGQSSWTARRSDAWPFDISFVSGSFVRGGTHELVAGADTHNVSLFDTRRQNVCQEFDLYLETPGQQAGPTRFVVEGSSGYIVYIGTESGDLYSLDLRTGRRLYFSGIGTNTLRYTKMYPDYPQVPPSDPIRVLNKHHHHPLIISAGNYGMNIWDTNTRCHVATVDLNENLSHILIDLSSYNQGQSQVYTRAEKRARE